MGRFGFVWVRLKGVVVRKPLHMLFFVGGIQLNLGVRSLVFAREEELR